MSGGNALCTGTIRSCAPAIGAPVIASTTRPSRTALVASAGTGVVCPLVVSSGANALSASTKQDCLLNIEASPARAS